MPGMMQPDRTIHFNPDGTANVRVKSLFGGEWNEAVLDITQDQWNEWQSGRQLIQNALPHLNNSQREFLMSGATEGEWTKLWAEPK
jgi:hypothetical protein